MFESVLVQLCHPCCGTCIINDGVDHAGRLGRFSYRWANENRCFPFHRVENMELLFITCLDRKCYWYVDVSCFPNT